MTKQIEASFVAKERESMTDRPVQTIYYMRQEIVVKSGGIAIIKKG